MTGQNADNVVVKLADHRVDWNRIERRIEAALQHEGPDDWSNQHLGPFVAVSRMPGTDGAAFAQRLGQALGWPVLGSEIVDLIAETFQLDSAALHALDEAKSNWVRDVLGELIPHQVINQDTYIHYLGKVIRLIGLHGNVVFIGRGAHFFLPRHRGISVRLVAPDVDRVHRLVSRHGISEAAAGERIHDEDRRHAHFADHYFGRAVDDATLYDLVLNRSTLTDDELVASVLAVCRNRGYYE